MKRKARQPSARRAAEWTWPEFSEPELVERLLMDEPDFLRFWLDVIGRLPDRAFTEEIFLTGTSYPWPRPDGSFVLEGPVSRPLDELDPGTVTDLVRRFTGPGSGRTPMLAIGANASPEGLERKFGHFPDPEDRSLLAVSGRLHDFDVAATAALTFYGAMPATIVPSPGTRVGAAILWLTPTQLTQLAWAEMPYRIGRLEGRFTFDRPVGELAVTGLDRVLAFVHRFGAFGPDAHPLALAAVPAEERTVPALTQAELLESAAGLILGPGASARDLVRRTFERPGETWKRVIEVMRANSIPFESDRWTPFPRPAGPGRLRNQLPGPGA